MENARHSLSSLPIFSRLDQLDFIIKNLERQQNDPKWRYENAAARKRPEGPLFPPVDAAVRETYFKGSLLERVAALENRLFQLCLEMESSSTSSTSTGGSGGESSNQRTTKRDILRTLPSFNNVFRFPNQLPKHHPVFVNNNDKFEIQEMGQTAESEKEKRVQKTKQEKEKKTAATAKEEYKTCKTKKKKSPYKWAHFNLFGC